MYSGSVSNLTENEIKPSVLFQTMGIYYTRSFGIFNRNIKGFLKVIYVVLFFQHESCSFRNTNRFSNKML